MTDAKFSKKSMTCSGAVAAEADKLLQTLAASGISIRLDRTRDEPRLLLSVKHAAVSVSRGSFSLASMAELVSAGSVVWQSGALHAQITPEGQARIQRKYAQQHGTMALGVSPFAAQHRQLVLEDQSGAPSETTSPLSTLRLRDESESPLAWLARRNGKDGRPLISQTQFQAGERLRTDLTIAAMLPRTSANWGGVGGGQGGAQLLNATDLMLSARQRAQKALTGVGPEFSGILMDICGFLKGLTQIESERNWPARSGKVVLGMALNSLAAHFGLRETARGPDIGKLRQWGTSDYRPSIAGSP